MAKKDTGIEDENFGHGGDAVLNKIKTLQRTLKEYKHGFEGFGREIKRSQNGLNSLGLGFLNTKIGRGDEAKGFSSLAMPYSGGAAGPRGEQASELAQYGLYTAISKIPYVGPILSLLSSVGLGAGINRAANSLFGPNAKIADKWYGEHLGYNLSSVSQTVDNAYGVSDKWKRFQKWQTDSVDKWFGGKEYYEKEKIKEFGKLVNSNYRQ